MEKPDYSKNHNASGFSVYAHLPNSSFTDVYQFFHQLKGKQLQS